MTNFFKKTFKRIVKKIPIKDSHKQLFKNKVSNFINSSPLIKKFLQERYRKYMLFLFSAVLMSLGIFYFMSLLVSTGKAQKFSESQNVSVNFLLNKVLNELELRSRRIPKKPKEEKAPPETPKLKTQKTELEKPSLSSHLPQLDLPDDFQSDSKGGAVSGQRTRDSAVTPIFRINPIYPRKAALQNIEGFVVLQFDITETGQVDNISVIQASPPQIFNSSAVQALRKWKYKARVENGKAVRQNNLKVQLDFQLTNE